MHSNEHEHAIGNCGNRWGSQCPPAATAVRRWHKPGPGQVLQLLAAAAPAIRPAAAALMRQLARQPWRIGAIAPAAVGASGGGAHGPQFRLWVGARPVLLHCRETPQLQVVGLDA